MSSEDNWSLDLSNIPTGDYQVLLKVKSQSDLAPFSDTLYAPDAYFRVSALNDIGVSNILEPVSMKDYPIGDNLGIKVISTITNYGLSPAPISSF